jgi:hypothetical protein
LCKIGIIGKPGNDFPTRLLFTKQLIDEGYDRLLEEGNYGYLLRGLGELYLNYTYAELLHICESGTFYFQIEPNSEKTKAIPQQYVPSHFLHAFEVHTNDFGGKMVLTQSSAVAISSNSETAATSINNA